MFDRLLTALCLGFLFWTVLFGAPMVAKDSSPSVMARSRALRERPFLERKAALEHLLRGSQDGALNRAILNQPSGNLDQSPQIVPSR